MSYTGRVLRLDKEGPVGLISCLYSVVSMQLSECKMASDN